MTGEVPFPGPEVSDLYRQIERGLPDIDPRCKGLLEPLEQVSRSSRRPGLPSEFGAVHRHSSRRPINFSRQPDSTPGRLCTDHGTNARAPRLYLCSARRQSATPVNLRLLVSRHQVGPDAFVPIAANRPQPGRLTRDMKKVPQSRPGPSLHRRSRAMRWLTARPSRDPPPLLSMTSRWPAGRTALPWSRRRLAVSTVVMGRSRGTSPMSPPAT